MQTRFDADGSLLLRIEKSDSRYLKIATAVALHARGRVLMEAGVWDESKHKRADDGKFGSGGGGAESMSKDAVKVSVDKNAVQVLRQHNLTGDDVASMAGAIPGASVSISAVDEWDDDDRIRAVIQHPDYYAVRYIDGNTIRNEEITVMTSKGNGTGSKVFSQQVAEAVKRGYKKIICQATRNSEMNGYYTWARLGYDGKVPMGKHGGKQISELMKTQEGRDWWKEHGQTFSATFDLTEGSQSRRVLDAYNEERAARSGATGRGGSGDDRGGRGDSGRSLGQVSESAEQGRKLAEPSHDTEDLANLYADLWGDTAPEDMDQDELATAQEELAGGSHGVDWDGDAGEWVVVETGGRDMVESWEEDKHPRADDGKFGSGGGGDKTSLPRGSSPINALHKQKYSGKLRAPNPHLSNQTRKYLASETATKAVAAYGMSQYHGINKALWAGKEPHREDEQHTLDGLKEAFAMTPPLDKPITVHRGVFLSGNQRDAFVDLMRQHAESGEPFDHKGFMSASTGGIVKEGETEGHVYDRKLQFVVKATHGLDVTPIADDEHKNEREFLIAPGKFKIHSVQDNDGKFIVNMEQIADEKQLRESAELLEAQARSPKGDGISINGKHYKPGQFIPAAEYDKATPEQKEKIDHPAKAAELTRKGRGSVDHGKVSEKLKKHSHHELSTQEKTSAKRSFAALHRHHGDLVLHRLEEIADQLQAAHDREGNTEGQTEQFSRRLKAVEHQIEMAKGKGVTGEVKVEDKPLKRIVLKDKKPRQGPAQTLRQIVKEMGGISIASLKAHGFSVKDLREDGIGGLFTSKHRRDLTELAHSLHDEGHIYIPGYNDRSGGTDAEQRRLAANPAEYLLDNLKEKVKSLHVEREAEFRRVEKQYFKDKADAEQFAETSGGQAGVEETLRISESDAQSEIEVGGDDEDAGSMADEGQAGDEVGDFNFGFNAEEEPASAPEGKPKTRIMGEDMAHAESQEIDGVLFDRFETENGGAVRLIDADSGNVLPQGLTKYPSVKAAQDAYAEHVAKARKMAGDSPSPARKPIDPDHIAQAKRKLSGGNLPIKGNADSKPITSDLSGEQIRRYVELPNGARIHPDELQRVTTDEDGNVALDPHENISIKDPMNKGDASAKSFATALRDTTAIKGRDDDRVTLQTPHGYSVTKTRGEWREVDAGSGSMSAWYDRQNPEAVSEAAAKSEKPAATMGGESESADFFKAPAEQQGLYSWDTPAANADTAEDKAVKAKYADKPKVELLRAPAGGAMSDVDGMFYKGGRLMPVHGLSPKVDKSKGEGLGTGTAAKADEDKAKASTRQPRNTEMSAEDIEDERQKRDRLW